MLLVDPQLESDKERHERQERELKQSLEQQRQAAAQAQQDADSAAMRHHRELETLKKRFQVTRTDIHRMPNELRQFLCVLVRLLIDKRNSHLYSLGQWTCFCPLS